MLLGSAVGLWSYFAIAPYAAALLGAAVSAIVVWGFARVRPESFDWATLTKVGLLLTPTGSSASGGAK